MKKMKQRMKAKASKIVASILVAAMAVAIIPKFTGTGTVFAAGSKNGENTCLGTSGIAAPAVPASADSAWSGSYVYFGSYDSNPIKFRVLAPSTTAYGGSTLFLDSDKTLFTGYFDSTSPYSNTWNGSDIQGVLNGSFLNGFTSLEQGAIATSQGNGGLTYDSFLSYVYGSPVSVNDKVFLLDASEVMNPAYGYSSDCGYVDDDNDGNWSTGDWSYHEVANRKKGGESAFWWLRSALTYNSARAGGVDHVGDLYDYYVYNYYGLAPALNINQSSIIFSSLISGNFNTAGAEYKLTILDEDLQISVTGGQEVTATGTTITVPYQISGTDAGNATRASVLILDKSYGTSGAQILYYDALGGTFSNSGASTGTFELPSTLDISGWGTNYYVYILAEDINEAYATDYASAPVAIDASAGAVTTNYTVTYSVVNGTWADGTTTDKTETVTNGASPASVPTGMIAASGYTGGSWDTDPTTATVTTDATFTYTFDAVTTYNVTVNSGTADVATAASGITVSITADTAPAGKVFDKWEIVSGTITLTDATSSTTTFTMPAENVEVTATYRDIPITTHTVTFNANGHGPAPASQTVNSGETVTEPTAPTESGWKFGGWYTDAECTTTFDFSTAITGDITLYAKWTEESVVPVTYTVTFETNGGSAVVAQAVEDGGKATKPTNPTREGFTFDGWYQDATFSVAFSFDTPITADITIYAKWTQNSDPTPTPVDVTPTPAPEPTTPTPTPVPGTAYYTVVSGENGSWTKNSGTGYTLTVKRSEDDDSCFSHFTGVQIDGVALVSGTDYTAVAGSTIVTINAATLENMSEGGHTITVLFDDGQAVTSINIKAATSTATPTPAPGTGIPATGEEVGPTLMLGSVCIVVAVSLFAVVLVMRKKRSIQ